MLALLLLAALPKVEVHGHRGARAVRPENTIAGFRYALDSGVDALELDLAVTKDDVLVVSHDPEVDSAICSGHSRAIRSMTLEQVRKLDCGSKKNPRFPKQQLVPGARMPTLDEVLALAAPTKVDLNIETKIFPARPQLTPTPQRFASLLVRAIRKRGLVSRTIVQSFDYRTLAAVRKLDPKIRLALLNSDDHPDFVPIAKSLGLQIISPHHEWITRSDVDALHAIGVLVVPWTVNDPAEVDRLVAMGVDAIITDDPALIIAHLAAAGRR